MASIIRIKRSSSTGNPSVLAVGELAYSSLAGTQSNGGDRLYIGAPGTEVNGNATSGHIVIGGKYFTDMLDHVAGTLTASSAIIVDANNKIDQLKTTNITIGGAGSANTIQSTNTNGNILLDPDGTGYVQIVGTNHLVIPVGTSGQQAAGVQGAIRFNSTNNAFEGYNGTAWASLGGVKSVDGLTYITAETSAGTSNDELEFYAAAADNVTSNKYAGLNRTRFALLQNTGATSTTSGSLQVTGGAGISENLYVGGNVNIASTGTLTYGGTTLAASVTGTGSMVLSASPTFTGTVTIPGATAIQVGTPTQGTLTGAATFTSTTSVTNTIGTLNQILSKLIPTQPTAFPGGNTLTINNVASYRMAVAQASQVKNGNLSTITVAPGSTVSVLRTDSYGTNTIQTMGPGDSGTLTVVRNTTNTATHTLTVGNNTTPVVTCTITATGSTADVTFTQGTGVITAGHKLQAGATGGGLTNGNYYYVQAVAGNTLTLKNYNNTTGVIGADFVGTPATGLTTTMTAKSDDGTYTGGSAGVATNLVIANNNASPVATPGFWESFDVSVNQTSAVSPGWNTVQIQHSGAGNTNLATWYYDSSSPGTPVVTAVSITPPASPTVKYSSNVPHYDSGQTFTLNATATALSGDCYPTSNTFCTGTAGGAFTAPTSLTYATAGITTPLTQNLYVGGGSASLTTTSTTISGFGSSSTGPSLSVTNSYSTGTGSFTTALSKTVLYKSTTAGTQTVLDEGSILINSVGNGSGAGYRVPNPGSTDTPVFTAGQTAFDSQSGTIQTYDAKIVANALKHDVTNYSTGYLPVGPNFSSHAAAQYFTFVFIRSSVSKFSINFTTNGSTAGVAGMWVAMPGANGTTSSLNKWLSLSIDANSADGAALAGLLNTTTNGTYTQNVSFGNLSSTNSTNNEIWVRIKLTAGQSISALYIGAATV